MNDEPIEVLLAAILRLERAGAAFVDGSIAPALRTGGTAVEWPAGSLDERIGVALHASPLGLDVRDLARSSPIRDAVAGAALSPRDRSLLAEERALRPEVVESLSRAIRPGDDAPKP